MATFAADTDLLEYEPQIRDYGIHNFSELHEKTYDDIIRLLNIKWWPTQQYGINDITVVGGAPKLTNGRLDSNQFTRAAVYHVLAYYIYPRLSSFTEEQDSFERKMNYYKEKFNEESADPYWTHRNIVTLGSAGLTSTQEHYSTCE